jgi:hypothetical protein
MKIRPSAFIAVVIFGFGIYQISSALVFRSRAEYAMGEIIGSEGMYFAGGPIDRSNIAGRPHTGGGGVIYGFARVGFKDSKGNQYSFGIGNGFEYPSGMSLRVIYDPEDPVGARVDSFYYFWFYPLMFFSFSIGIFYHYLKRFLKKRERKLTKENIRA